MEYVDHSRGPKRGYDWQRWGVISLLILVVGLALAFSFFYFKPVVVAKAEAWRDKWQAQNPSPSRPQPDDVKAPVGPLTQLQMNAIAGWQNGQKNDLGMDTFEWHLVRGPDPMTRDFKVSLDVKVNWHQPGQLHPQQQVCRLTMQEMRDRNNNLFWMVTKAVPGTVCDARVIR